MSRREPVCINDLDMVDLAVFLSPDERARVREEIASDGIALVWTSTFGAPTRVGVTGTAQPNGGLRLWWICPACERRSALLYGDPRGYRLVCRPCTGLAYRSQRESGSRSYDLVSRHLRAALRARLRRTRYRDGTTRRNRRSPRQDALRVTEAQSLRRAIIGLDRMRVNTSPLNPRDLASLFRAEAEAAELAARITELV